MMFPGGVTYLKISIMTRIEGKIFKIKKDKINTWKEWAHRLETEFLEEAKETLIEENSLREAFIGFSIGNDYYTVGLSIPKKDGLLPAKERELNTMHKKMKKECFESRNPIEVLYDIGFD